MERGGSAEWWGRAGASHSATGLTAVGPGLALVAGVPQANIATGVAGGQTIIGGTAAGESLTIRSTSNATKGTIVADSRLLLPDGTQAAPALSFSSATTTGLFLTAGALAVSIANAEIARMNASGVVAAAIAGSVSASGNLTLSSTQHATKGAIVTQDTLQLASGTTSIPGLSFSAATNTGLYYSGSLGIVVGGGEVARVTSGAFIVGQDTVCRLRIVNVTSLAICSLQIIGNTGTGISFPGGVNTLSIVANGTESIRHSATLIDEKVDSQSVLNTRATAQFDKTSSTALANITGLTATLTAGASYAFEATLWIDAPLGGAQVAVSGTCTATAVVYTVRAFGDNPSGGEATLDFVRRLAVLGGAGVGSASLTKYFMKISGLITVNAAGTLTVQFAQAASNATASSVLVGSHFNVQRIA